MTPPIKAESVVGSAAASLNDYETPNRKLLSVSEVANQYGIPKRTIYRLIELGSLAVVKLGVKKGWRIRPEAVERLLADREEVHTPMKPSTARASSSRVLVSPEHQRLIEKHLG